MKIKRLYVNNFKSLVNFELVEPNAFSVFVGPNAAGKSNVFEALEFFSYAVQSTTLASDLFGGAKSICRRQNPMEPVTISLSLDGLERPFKIELKSNPDAHRLSPVLKISGVSSGRAREELEKENHLRNQFLDSFSRLFINQKRLVKINTNGEFRLRLDGANLPSVLKRVLGNEIKREEILDWLVLLIPEFEDIQIESEGDGANDTLLVKEKYTKQYFTRELLSDGTYHIVALLTAIYQSDEPQFLCIEEPENGLNPYVIRTLVEFFRNVCEEKGHYIWLNTHSPMLVKCLQPKELILIDKVDGVTKAKQIDPNLKYKSMPLDEAWLTNSLGGGLPW